MTPQPQGTGFPGAHFRAAQLEALLTALDLPDEEYAALAQAIASQQPDQGYLAQQFAREWEAEGPDTLPL